jgi:hypothetical protein
LGGLFSLPDLAQVGAAGPTGGIARTLDPRGVAPVVFEEVRVGFVGGETLAGLGAAGTAANLLMTKGTSNTLYGIDTVAAPMVIWNYTDNLCANVGLESPLDGVTVAGTDRATFTWRSLADTATGYEIQVNELSDFTGPDLGNALVEDTSWSTGAGWFTAGTKYYWRVRVIEPFESRYSGIFGAIPFSFTTRVGTVEAPIQVSPAPGAQGIILTPAFDWLPVAGAVSYEVEVADNPDFAPLVTSGAPTSNIWAIDTSLEYATVYYWRVRGISEFGTPAGDWVVSIFTTEAAPVEAPPPVIVETPPAQPAPEITLPAPQVTVELPPQQVISPTWIYAIIGIGAALAVVVIVLIVRTRRP